VHVGVRVFSAVSCAGIVCGVRYHVVDQLLRRLKQWIANSDYGFVSAFPTSDPGVGSMIFQFSSQTRVSAPEFLRHSLLAKQGAIVTHSGKP